MVTKEEQKQILKNEERLWDMAAITIAPTLIGNLYFNAIRHDEIAKISFDMADALILERRKRLKETP